MMSSHSSSPSRARSQAAVVITRGDFRIFVNDMSALPQVCDVLGLGSLSSSPSCSRSSSRTAELFNIADYEGFSDVGVGTNVTSTAHLSSDVSFKDSKEISVQTDFAVSVLVDSSTQSDACDASGGSMVDTADVCCGSDLALFQVYVPPVVAEVAVQSDAPGVLIDTGMMTCEPTVSLADAMLLMDQKVASVTDDMRIMGDNLRVTNETLSDYQAKLDKVSADRDDLVLKLNKVSSDRDDAVMKLKKLETLFHEGDHMFDKKKKKDKQR
eukprot:TRINITY_DN5703_c0_g2_i1.p1 TRINITY_DN5703_c0_g2~~TRINITY_DN5703_c0_g2_i1.p1  ORF type:complete len:269 (+),score=65.82 TRINITY_DN5703_c0_g2_i1:66-872(+)